jgi:hypothetical protein
MKKSIFFFTTISSLLLFSCKKENPATPNTNVDKVKTYTETLKTSSGTISATYYLEYDLKNRITSVVFASNPSDKFVFTYNSDSQFSMDLFSGSGNIHEDIFLNNSQLDSTYQYNDTQDTTTEKYVYSGNNQLVKLSEYGYYNGHPILSNTTTYTYDGNGNVMKTMDTDNNVETFDYYPDLVYTMPITSPVIPSRKTNLVKTHTVTSNGYLVASVTSTYTFDDKNRISTITDTASDGSVGTKTFTYF